ncbi:hypothetical protein SLEP1_g4041 [Rubroshorea leprosula]|uniref:Secreted protein n=1 Tax=Rubroshorea leprosula TaxID=152421 RepID=A0AAV5HMW3_9ROSI|nr:hypothetical protein SLEP1_g4041 [Rubroshorea leprosula]
MLEPLGSLIVQACWSQLVLPPSMTLRGLSVSRSDNPRLFPVDLGRGSLVFSFFVLFGVDRRPSFSFDGSEVAHARATRADAHRSSPASFEELPPPDLVTARHPGAWCYLFKGR